MIMILVFVQKERKVLMANRALQDLRVVKEKTDMHLKFQKMDSGWFGMLKLKTCRDKIKAATDIYVAADASNPLVWILNIFNKETKEWETVSMPKSARITSMSVLGIKAMVLLMLVLQRLKLLYIIA